GKEDNLEFWGNSFIADPFGEITAQASGSKEEVLLAEIGLSKVKSSQEGWMFLKNRQPKDYSELVK
ncbi:MAG: nitrilase-related carbon-nitrogen hydrolase, partial [Nanoarchaeota archaeon]